MPQPDFDESPLPESPLDDLGTISSRRQTLVLALGVEGGLIPLSLLLCLFFEINLRESIHWSLDHFAAGFAATIPLVLLMLVTVQWPIGPLRSILESMRKIMRGLFSTCGPSDFLWISIVAGIGEELMFRGFVQNLATQWFNPTLGLIIASIIFGLVHSITPAYIILTSCIGLYLGLLYQFTNNLMPPMIVHGLYDFVALTYLRHRIGNPSS